MDVAGKLLLEFQRESVDAVSLAPERRPTVRARVVVVGGAVEEVLSVLCVQVEEPVERSSRRLRNSCQPYGHRLPELRSIQFATSRPLIVTGDLSGLRG